MGLFDEEYWNTFNQQNQSDNLHAETGENSQRQSGMSGQIRNTPKTGTSTARRTRMIGYHDPVTPENSVTMKHLVQMGLADRSDNVHAQQDASGQSYGKNLTDAVNRGVAKVGKQLAYGMKLNADEHLSRAENPVPDIVKKGIVYGKSQAEHQDESAALMLKKLFEKMRHDAIQGTLDQPIETTVNGKDKLGLVTGGFKNEFVTKPQNAFWSAGTIAGDAARAVAPEGNIDNTALDHAEMKRDSFQRELDWYEDHSMHLKDIWDNDNAENTINNLSQYFYESLGSKAPYAAIAALRPFIEAAPLTSRLASGTAYQTALNHSGIKQQTGQSNYPKAVVGGALNATARELPFLNRTFNPYGKNDWAKLGAHAAGQAIRYGTDQWMGKRNPDDNDKELD